MIEEELESISAIDYSSRVDKAEEDVALVGYVFNDPQCRHFYPIYIKNPKFGETCTEPCIAMAKYIKYTVNYTYVKGTMGIGHAVCTNPVTVGRRARFYTRMTEANWRELQRGNKHKFAVNEVLSQLGDCRLTGEVNRYHNYQETLSSLENILRDQQQAVNNTTKEVLEVERACWGSKQRLEMANAHQEIRDRFHSTFGRPPLCSPHCTAIHSPEQTPLTPQTRGPVEMPTLAEGEHHRCCYWCQSTKHMVSQCPRKKVSKKKPAKRTLVQRMKPQEDLMVIGTLRANTEQMELYKRVALLDRTEWTLGVCHTCGRMDPKHNNLECPLYKQCPRCRGTGAFGYVKAHTCYPTTTNPADLNLEYNDCDYDLYWNQYD